MSHRTIIRPFFDPATWTVTYVVSDNATHRAAIIDPVLDYDFRSGHTDTKSADKVIAYLKAHGLTVEWILETHAHADHTSRNTRAAASASARTFARCRPRSRRLYNPERTFLPDGSQFDHLFKDGETFSIGDVRATAVLVPGHTPADIAYLLDDAVFVGDTLFMPDVGTARADFPGGDAHTLYRSIRRLLALPPQTRLFVCHDYPPAGREPRWETTVAEQRARNIHIRDGISEEEFATMREARDATLELPTLILPSLQVNVRAGQLPEADDNGVAYLRVPLNALPVASKASAGAEA